MLDDGRAAFNPVAGIEIGKAVKIAHGSGVDVAANDAIDPVLERCGSQRFFEISNEIDGILDPCLGPGRQRPIGKAQFAAHLTDAR